MSLLRSYYIVQVVHREDSDEIDSLSSDAVSRISKVPVGRSFHLKCANSFAEWSWVGWHAKGFSASRVTTHGEIDVPNPAGR